MRFVVALMVATAATFVLGTCGVYVYKAVWCPAEYDAMVNDWCGARLPPEGALPAPSGWRMLAQENSCGSGGCFHRIYLLHAPGVRPALEEYVAFLDGEGWEMTREDGGVEASKGELVVRVEALSPDSRAVPSNVTVSPASEDEHVIAVLNYVDFGERWRDAATQQPSN